jgi:hypothetical protein
MTSTTDPQLVTAAEVAVHAWAATHTDPGPIFTDPDVPPDGGHPPQIWAVMDRAAHEAQELNHPWIGEDHLVLGMLHPDGPGAARTVLESFGIRQEPLRQAFIASMGDPWDPKPTHTRVVDATEGVALSKPPEPLEPPPPSEAGPVGCARPGTQPPRPRSPPAVVESLSPSPDDHGTAFVSGP